MKWINRAYKLIILILLLLIYNEVMTIRMMKTEEKMIELIDPKDIKQKPAIFHEVIP